MTQKAVIFQGNVIRLYYDTFTAGDINYETKLNYRRGQENIFLMEQPYINQSSKICGKNADFEMDLLIEK